MKFWIANFELEKQTQGIDYGSREISLKFEDMGNWSFLFKQSIANIYPVWWCSFMYWFFHSFYSSSVSNYYYTENVSQRISDHGVIDFCVLQWPILKSTAHKCANGVNETSFFGQFLSLKWIQKHVFQTYQLSFYSEKLMKLLHLCFK